jgi:hypothetical protein
MNYTKLEDMREYVLHSKETAAIACLCDRNTRTLTRHNKRHLLRASGYATSGATQVEAAYAGTFLPELINFDIPVAGFTHDFDRSLTGKHVPGKKADEVLRSIGVPAYRRWVIFFANVNHSAAPSRHKLSLWFGTANIAKELADILAVMTLTAAERRELEEILHTPVLLEKLIKDVCQVLSTTVWGDKADSGRVRVRPAGARHMEKLIAKGEFRSYFYNGADENYKNWMANYAILRSRLIVDPTDVGGWPAYKGSILQVWDLDPRVTEDDTFSVADILGIVWFARGQHGCENAAQNVFGLNYGIEANGERWFYDKNTKDGWKVRKHPAASARKTA